MAATTSSRSKRRRDGYTARELDDVLGFAIALTCLSVVLACLQEPRVRETPAPANAAKTVASSNVAAAPRGAPANSPLHRFRENLSKLAQGQVAEPVRVLWLGDSHTAGVSWPASVEAALRKHIDSGGAGYIPLGLAYGRQHGARVVADEPFDVAPHPPARRTQEDDGVFGLGGTRVTTKGKSLGITLKFDQDLSSGRCKGHLLFRYKSPADQIVIRTGEGASAIKADGAKAFEGGVQTASVSLDARQPLEIRVASGNPELFGFVIENEKPGVVFDVLGINGARFATPLAWDESAWTALVRWRKPSLAIIAYGTNEVFDLVAPQRYVAEIRRLVERIRSAVPDIECILAGPTDVGRGGESAEARVRAIDEVEAAAAESLGCAYFSPYQTMGGANGFDEWLHSEPPLAVSDRIHLTTAGYRRLGQAMAEALFMHPAPVSNDGRTTEKSLDAGRSAN